ncbi:MAG: AMP-binding protein [Planctomycetota bacterium]
MHDEGKPVPRDDATAGEVIARGDTVTPGYWNRPEETARAIRGGWFLTGDLATIEAEGWHNVVDRAKDVILSDGEKRIEGMRRPASRAGYPRRVPK